MKTGHVSFWVEALGRPTLRAPLSGDIGADVCIIGAGFTGLWAAYYLKQADPSLKIAIVERDFAGFGASGRNGGWLTGGFAWNHDRYAGAGQGGVQGVRDMVTAMGTTVAEVCRVADLHGIEADIHPTQELMIATNPAQLIRLRAEITHRQSWGEARISELDAHATAARIHLPNALGAMMVEGVARVQPAKLVRGLASVVEGLGVAIYEGTTVQSYGANRVTTDRGRVGAGTVLRCTEGFTAGLPDHRRDLLPLNSAQIITPVLPPEVWAKIGWQGAEIIGDFNHAYCYCQRTADGRIAVGGRGMPYRFGSAIDKDGTPDALTIRRLTASLARHFPAAVPYGVAHAWCGVLGVPRDWCASVTFDPATGIGAAGGYVGVGVSTSNLAGQTLADLTLRRDTPLTRLPWVNHIPRKWEPEPLRWLGVQGMYALYAAADRAEAKTGRPSALAALGNHLTGH